MMFFNLCLFPDFPIDGRDYFKPVTSVIFLVVSINYYLLGQGKLCNY